MIEVIPWHSLLGGALLGLSATLLLLVNGKIAGISGILSGLLKAEKSDFSWRLMFVIGMVAGGVWGATAFSADVPIQFETPLWLVAVAGLLVGVGTKMGNGCTSGHGICGIGRLSPRSIIATCVFMTVAAAVVFVRLHLI